MTGCAAAAARRPCVEPLLRLCLERAYNQRDGGVTEIKSDRLMRGLVGDPRYNVFLRKLKLPQ